MASEQEVLMVRVAVVQPKVDRHDREKNVELAVGYVRRAAAQGARIVCLPETYPGPWTPPLDYDPLPELTACAAELDLYLVAGLIEPAGPPGAYHNSLVLLGPGGEVGRYRRTTPAGPWIYAGGTFWDFGYTAATELPVFDTPHGRVGLLVCSEVYVPELARALALDGAEILLMPAGLWKKGQWDTWRTLTRARAIENLAFTATCQNLLGHETANAGLAMICSPEETLVESAAEGVLVADCDLERLRWLRELEDGPGFPGEKRCKTGVLWQWYRPELLGHLAGRPEG
jgi:predicted amidohydrolase